MAKSNDISHSFTDLMTSLAVIFILLLVATLNNAFSESDNAKEDLRKEVIEELKKINLTITEDPTDPYTQIINLDEDKVKFAYDKADLQANGKILIWDLFKMLTPKLCDEPLKSKIESLIVEGHTDSKGNNSTKGKLKNIKLSQDRAYSVLKEAVGILENTPTYVDCLRNISLSTGRGSAQLKATDDLSRRVEIKIRVKSNMGIQSLLKRQEK